MEETSRKGTVIPQGADAVDDLVAGIFGEAQALDVGTLARRLAMTSETLRRHVRRGRLAAVCVGGRWRVSKRAVEGFLAVSACPHRPGTHWTPATAYHHGPAVLDCEDTPPPQTDDAFQSDGTGGIPF